MRTFNMNEHYSWGNNIHLVTSVGTYSGSGQCYARAFKAIIARKPDPSEFQRAIVQGHMSVPFVKDHDRLIYDFSDGRKYVMEFFNIKYERDPYDLFTGEVNLLGTLDEVNRRPVCLGKKTYWWKIEVFLLAPFWYFHANRKSWQEFKHGLIKHKCEFDQENPRYEHHAVAGRVHMLKVYPCKHFGCNVVDPDC